MTITKLKTIGRWGGMTNDLTQVGTHLGGRRVITGMLTGTPEPATIGADEPERGGRMIDPDEPERGGRMIGADEPVPAIVAGGSGPRRAPK